MSKGQNHVGFELFLEGGCVGRPSRLVLWNEQKLKKITQFQNPLRYFADALLATSAHELAAWSSTENYRKHPHFQQWTEMEAHFELYKKATPRVESLYKESPRLNSEVLKKFEERFSKALTETFSKPEIDFRDFEFLIDKIEALESDLKAPLLYNFSMKFSENFCDQLQVFYSFLWNLRSLVAVDYNAHIQDPSHEALPVDSVSDYLAKSEYVVNDALLYYQFKKLSTPFVSGRHSDVKIDKLFVEPMKKAFASYSHNASYLIDHLPESFLAGLHTMELEEALHLVQMDWLLGSTSGMLFKIREELFGLQSGYEKIFWPMAEGRPKQKSVRLEVACSLKSLRSNVA